METVQEYVDRQRTPGYDKPAIFGAKPVIQVWQQTNDGIVRGKRVGGMWKARLAENHKIWGAKGGKFAVLIDILLTLRSFGYSDQLEDYDLEDNLGRPVVV